MNYSIIFIFLLSCLLIIMLVRIRLPLGAKVVGKPVGEVALSFRERLLLQRVNLGAFGIVLILAATLGHLTAVWDIVFVAAAVGLLLIPVRYVITSKGLAVNNVVFRQWDEFTGFQINHRRGIRLVPQDGVKPFELRVTDNHEQELIVLLHRCSKYGGPETQILRKAVVPVSESVRETELKSGQIS